MNNNLSFAYTQNIPPDIEEYEDMFLKNMPCKHVMRLSSEKAVARFKASIKIGYDRVVWGKRSGLSANEDWNRKVQLNDIQNIIYKKRIHPVRVVIDDMGVPWIDNLHNGIANILCNDGAKLRDIPHYIARHNDEYNIELIDPYNVIDLSRIDGLLEYTEARFSRVSQEVSSVEYSIEEFMEDNDIRKDELTIDDSYYAEYFALIHDFLAKRV